MVGGCRGEAFDRAGSLRAAIYPVEHIGDNSTAALSSQPSHIYRSREKICADTKFGPGFQILQNGFQMLRDPINSVETPTGGECTTTFRKILGVPPSVYLRG
jgi:hypothetical protein